MLLANNSSSSRQVEVPIQGSSNQEALLSFSKPTETTVQFHLRIPDQDHHNSQLYESKIMQDDLGLGAIILDQNNLLVETVDAKESSSKETRQVKLRYGGDKILVFNSVSQDNVFWRQLTQTLLEQVQQLRQDNEEIKKQNIDLMNLIKDGLYKPWKQVGVLKDLETLWTKYSPYEYEYGIKFNTCNVTPVVMQEWNRGKRVFSQYPYSHGDNAVNLHEGRSLFTKDTDDPESKSCWYHRYINSEFKVCCGSNKIFDNWPVFVRRM
ncbi:hypothetical protein C9374_002771 [Naegleria lovaniensis]|uniref:Uncharacterized protein n=1 Tax=Naegleria lovaniensis TaxID=51637 RepID=A0AA88GT03_NAELO|nr:uncharacterized protein C9374_002771 [Naegleria lovaniensis]KAG2386325.1 hypothetical protein C9374_002771 [Naegleria lovaniensis]